MAISSRTAARPVHELNLQQLRSFFEVCRLGGYTAAARELKLSSPSVWEQIRNLEAHYGVVLLERHGNRIEPTHQGRRLLDLVGPALTTLESSRTVLHQHDGKLPRSLLLVTNLRVLADQISSAAAQFRSRFEGVRLDVLFTQITEVEPQVVGGVADVAFTLEPGPDKPLPATLVYEPAGALDYLLVVPPQHPLLRKKELALESILEFPLILADESAYSRRRIQEVLYLYHLTEQMQIAVQSNSDEYTPAFVRRGLGVGLVMGSPGSEWTKGLGVRSLRHLFGTAHVGFLWRRGAHMAPLQRELADLLRAGSGPPSSGRPVRLRPKGP